MLNKELEMAINLAYAEAQQRGFEYLTLEHLLLVLLDNREVNNTLQACGADLNVLRQDIGDFLNQNIPVISDTHRETQPTLAFQRVIQRAIFHIQSAGRSEVQALDILVSIFSEQESQAAFFIQKQGINRLDIISFISHGSTSTENEFNDITEEELLEEPKSAEQQLSQFCVNLNELAANDEIDPLIGRDKELTRVIQTLCRRRKNNPLLVGEAGVGKTAIAEG